MKINAHNRLRNVVLADSEIDLRNDKDMLSILKDLGRAFKLSIDREGPDGFVVSGFDKNGTEYNISILQDIRKSKNFYVNVSCYSSTGENLANVKASGSDLGKVMRDVYSGIRKDTKEASSNIKVLNDRINKLQKEKASLENALESIEHVADALMI